MTAISVGMQRRRINYFAHFWQNYTVKQPFLLYQLWKYYGADVPCWQVSQNHGTLRLAGTSGGRMVQASAQAGQQELRTMSRQLLKSPRRMLSATFITYCTSTFRGTFCVPVCAHYSWAPLKIFVLIASSLQVFVDIDEILLSLLQSE